MASLPAFHSLHSTDAGAQDAGRLEGSQAKEVDDALHAAEQTHVQSSNDAKAKNPILTSNKVIHTGHDKATIMGVEERGSGIPQALTSHPLGRGRDSVLHYSSDDDGKPENVDVIDLNIPETRALQSFQTEVDSTTVGSAASKVSNPSKPSQPLFLDTIDCAIGTEVNSCRESNLLQSFSQTSQSSKAGAKTTDSNIQAQINNTPSPTVILPIKSHENDVEGITRDQGADSADSKPLDKARSPQVPSVDPTTRSVVINAAQLETGSFEPESEAERLASVPNRTKETGVFIAMNLVKFCYAALGLGIACLGIMKNPPVNRPSASMWSIVLLALAFTVLAVLDLAVLFLISAVILIITNMRTRFDNGVLIDFLKMPTANYFYVLGSGGHTTEMIALIKLTHTPNKNTHRRYLVTAGDHHSVIQSRLLERAIRQSCPDGAGGTCDFATATRARSVHQSFVTSIGSSLFSAWDIVSALLTIPGDRAGHPQAELFRYPDVIVTNGPGTGFIVALVVFTLKVLFVVPRDRLKVVFVETWARGHKLGLTGKLFYWTKISNQFVVQSEELAKTLSVPCIGNVNQRWANLCHRAAEKKAAAEKAAVEQGAADQGAD